MKKVGIITFHASHNCGSMLQAFAIQTVIEEIGYQSEIINFSNYGQQQLYSNHYQNDNLKGIIKNMLIFPHRKRIEMVYNSYEDFIKNTFKLSKKKYSKLEELNENNLKYNMYVCGSDQIWNITIPDSDDAYFLPFVKKHKKIAYAPSFGAKNLKTYATNLEKYRNYLKSFDFLSIREKNGSKWLLDLIDREVPVVLDPTLIIDKRKYELLEQESGINGKYIFYYAPGYMKEITSFVEKLSKKYNLPVIVWNSKQYYIKGLKRKSFSLPINENPGIYLSLIKNAELVITTSFHGSIFSTIYKKNFWIMKNGGMYGDDDRVLTLVKELSLENRLIIPDFDDNFDYLRSVDYKQYDKNLIRLKNKSVNYLIEALGDSDERNK